MKGKLSIISVAIGIVLICLGLFESNTLGRDAQQYFAGSTMSAAISLLAVGTVALSGGVLVLARVASE